VILGQQVVVVHASPWGSTEHTQETVAEVDDAKIYFQSGAAVDKIRNMYLPNPGVPLKLYRIEHRRNH
jgi:hypothetical protein